MKKQSTTKGFAVLSAAGVLVKLLSLFYVPFLLHILGEEGYGIYFSAYQIFLFVYVLTNAGIPIAISKTTSELVAVKNYKDAVRSFKIARFMIIVLALVMSIAMFILAKPICDIAHMKSAYLAVAALAPTIFITSVTSVYRGYFQGRGNMVPTAVSQVVEQVANTVFSLLFAAIFIKYGAEAGSAGGTVGTAIGAFLAAVILLAVYEKNRVFKISPHEEICNKRHTTKQLAKRVIQCGIPITLCAALQNVGFLIDMGNITRRLASIGFSEGQIHTLYGMYGKYIILVNVPISFISALAAAVLPAISEAVTLKNRKLVRERIRHAFRLCFLVAVPSAVGLAILSKQVFELLKYGNGYKLMMYGSVVIILMAIVQIQITILQSLDKLYVVMFYLGFGIIGKLVANYIFVGIPYINITGAVAGNVAYFIIPLLLNNRLIKKTLKVRFSLLRQMKKSIQAAIVMGILVKLSYVLINYIMRFLGYHYIVNAVATAIAILVGMLSYFYVLCYVGGISEEDLNLLPRKIRKIIPKNIKFKKIVNNR